MCMMDVTHDGPVILFDGECNLCNGAVNFIIRRDPRKRFRFAPYQSAPGRALADQAGLTEAASGTIILLEEGHARARSTAALRIARRLRGLWPLLYVFIIIPRPIRDWVYDWVARNRYRWFGKRDECMIPGPEVKDRFLETTE